MRAAHGGSQTPSPALHDAALSTPPRAWGGRDYQPELPCDASSSFPPPGCCAPSPHASRAARPCQHSDEGEPQAVEDERVDPLLFARCALTAVPPALGLAGGRMAAAPSSSRLLPRLISAAPAFPSLAHLRAPVTSRRLLDWTRSRLNSAIPRRHRRRRLLSRREQSRRRWRRRPRRAAGRAAALARRIAGRGLLAPLASPPQQAEDRARRREERLDVGPCVLVNPFISRSSLLPSSERLDVVCACLDLAHGQADLARLLTARGVRRRRPHLDSRPPRHAPAPRRWPRPQGR
jgi:hypothetical protein